MAGQTHRSARFGGVCRGDAPQQFGVEHGQVVGSPAHPARVGKLRRREQCDVTGSEHILRFPDEVLFDAARVHSDQADPVQRIRVVRHVIVELEFVETDRPQPLPHDAGGRTLTRPSADGHLGVSARQKVLGGAEVRAGEIQVFVRRHQRLARGGLTGTRSRPESHPTCTAYVVYGRPSVSRRLSRNRPPDRSSRRREADGRGRPSAADAAQFPLPRASPHAPGCTRRRRPTVRGNR